MAGWLGFGIEAASYKGLSQKDWGRKDFGNGLMTWTGGVGEKWWKVREMRKI